MTTAQNVLDVARSQIGYHETGTNITKYWVELDPALQGQPWCSVFVSWCFRHAGAPLAFMDRPYGYMNAVDAMVWAKANGLWDASGHYAPGDILIYGGGSHTGICVSDDAVTIIAIEGNEADQVGQVTRTHGAYVSGVVKTSRLMAPEPTSAPPPPPAPAPAPAPALSRFLRLVRPYMAGQDVRTVQERVGTLIDGLYGPNTAGAVRAFQIRYWPAQPSQWDGIVGPMTARALGIAWTG